MTTVALALLTAWAAWSVFVIVTVLLAGRDDTCDCPNCALPTPPTYDPALTRMCPNVECRYVVVCSPARSCPVCWTPL